MGRKGNAARCYTQGALDSLEPSQIVGLLFQPECRKGKPMSQCCLCGAEAILFINDQPLLSIANKAQHAS
jgi:hypothetical protein